MPKMLFLIFHIQKGINQKLIEFFQNLAFLCQLWMYVHDYTT